MLTQGGATQDGCTPLFAAAQMGKEVVVRGLLDAGANREAMGKVRAKRGGERGGVGEETGCLSYFLGVLLPGFGEPFNLEQ